MLKNKIFHHIIVFCLDLYMIFYYTQVIFYQFLLPFLVAEYSIILLRKKKSLTLLGSYYLESHQKVHTYYSLSCSSNRSSLSYNLSLLMGFCIFQLLFFYIFVEITQAAKNHKFCSLLYITSIFVDEVAYNQHCQLSKSWK